MKSKNNIEKIVQEFLKKDRTSSNVAPYRVLNVGNSQPTGLLSFISAIEKELDMKAKIEFLDIQPGDVPRTFADASALFALTGYKPDKSIEEGVKEFINWYREYYEI